jgi:peroxiredoxin
VAALKIGEPMPDFELPDPTGKTVKLSEVTREQQNRHSQLLGELVRLLPRGNAELGKLYNAQKSKGFTILAIVDDRERPKLDAYLKQKPVSFPVLIDQDGALAKQVEN